MTGAARPTIVVAGALAQRPNVPGHAWVFLNWLHGLRALGFELVFLDRLEPHMTDDPRAPIGSSRQYRWLADVLDRAGFGGQHATLVDEGRGVLGMSRERLDVLLAQSVALLNFNGYLVDETVFGLCQRRVLIDIDPGFAQMWRLEHLHDIYVGHDAVATVGLDAPRAGSIVAATGLPTVATLPPVALDQWPALPAPRRSRPRFTSIATWRGPFGPIEHDGVTYGLRVHEFRKYARLPELVAHVDLEIALQIDATDGTDLHLLKRHGWTVVDPAQVARSLPDYQRYIAQSSAELQIAKALYVQGRTGWFSDRSACYLASGRPVVAQDTGFAAHVPTGKGLMAFADLDEAAAAIAEVAGNPTLHATAAHELAVEHFDARTVLSSLLGRLDVF